VYEVAGGGLNAEWGVPTSNNQNLGARAGAVGCQPPLGTTRRQKFFPLSPGRASGNKEGGAY